MAESCLTVILDLPPMEYVRVTDDINWAEEEKRKDALELTYDESTTSEGSGKIAQIPLEVKNDLNPKSLGRLSRACLSWRPFG